MNNALYELQNFLKAVIPTLSIHNSSSTPSLALHSGAALPTLQASDKAKALRMEGQLSWSDDNISQNLVAVKTNQIYSMIYYLFNCKCTIQPSKEKVPLLHCFLSLRSLTSVFCCDILLIQIIKHSQKTSWFSHHPSPGPSVGHRHWPPSIHVVVAAVLRLETLGHVCWR